MNKKIIFIVSVLLVVVVGIGVWLLQDQNENKNGNRGEDSVDITPKNENVAIVYFSGIH